MSAVGILSDYLRLNALKEMCRKNNFLAICPFNLFLACILNLGCGALDVSFDWVFFLTKIINFHRKKNPKQKLNPLLVSYRLICLDFFFLNTT